MSNYDSGFARAQAAYDNALPEDFFVPDAAEVCLCGHAADDHEDVAGAPGAGPCDDDCGCDGFTWSDDPDNEPDPDDERDRRRDAMEVE
jgi:hypothetical protein